MSLGNRHGKNLALLENVIVPHHHIFKNCDNLYKEMALKNPVLFNVEHGVEKAMADASNGLYEFVDAVGYDNSDFSDTKTTSVNFNTRVAEVKGIENKIGALRIVIYNPRSHRKVDYMFIPAAAVQSLALACHGNDSHKSRLLIKYSANGDHYNKFEQFRISTFENLAKKI